ncbi:MAG: hypothetical protein LQ348_000348 [Seirophora lacunosa]|nr:MAG: hypothetical protein LQ348_000348 [Seirophora lacunosa]
MDEATAENIAFNDRVTAYQLHRQLNRDLSQAPKAPPPAAIINLTERARHLIINRFTRFNSLKPDTIDLTSRTKPHQKSLATAVPTTAAPARNPGAGNQLVNGRVNDVHKKAEHSPEVARRSVRQTKIQCLSTRGKRNAPNTMGALLDSNILSWE